MGNRAVAAAALLVVACLTAGCDTGEPRGEERDEPPPTAAERFAQRPAEEVVKAAESAMRSLRSLHAEQGSFVDGRREQIMVSLSKRGECEATLIRDAAITKVRHHDGTAYFQPANGAAYLDFFGDGWEMISEFVGGRWLIEDLGVTNAVCGFKRLIDAIFEGEVEGAEVSGPEDLAGVPVVRVEMPSMELFVRAEKPHYVVRTENDGRHVKLSMFDRPVDGALPPTVDAVELDDVPGWSMRGYA